MADKVKESLLGEIIWLDGCHYVLDEPDENEWAEHKKQVRWIKEQKEKDLEQYRQRERPLLNKFIWIDGKHYIMHRTTMEMVEEHHRNIKAEKKNDDPGQNK